MHGQVLQISHAPWTPIVGLVGGVERVDVTSFVFERPRARQAKRLLARRRGTSLVEPMYVGNGDRTAVYPAELNPVIPM